MISWAASLVNQKVSPAGCQCACVIMFLLSVRGMQQPRRSIRGCCLPPRTYSKSVDLACKRFSYGHVCWCCYEVKPCASPTVAGSLSKRSVARCSGALVAVPCERVRSMFGCKSAHLLYYLAVGLSLLYQGHARHIGTNIARALQVACVIPRSASFKLL
jgi:hypothetical protein